MTKSKSAKSKKLSPVSVRLTYEERELLLSDAEGLSLSQHIRARLFGNGEQDLPNSERLSPQTRQRLLAQILIQLGKTNIAQNLSDLTEAARLGFLELSPEMQLSISELSNQLKGIRRELIKALGLCPGKDDCQ